MVQLYRRDTIVHGAPAGLGSRVFSCSSMPQPREYGYFLANSDLAVAMEVQEARVVFGVSSGNLAMLGRSGFGGIINVARCEKVAVPREAGPSLRVTWLVSMLVSMLVLWLCTRRREGPDGLALGPDAGGSVPRYLGRTLAPDVRRARIGEGMIRSGVGSPPALQSGGARASRPW